MPGRLPEIFLIVFFLTLSTSASLEAARPLTIVALGDSTTAGAPGFRSPAEAPPDGSGNKESQYAYWIMKLRQEWKVLNRGVNGERSDQILKRFQKDALAYRPEVLIVLAGINDLYQGYPIDEIKRNLADIYRRARKENIRVIACTVLPYNSASPQVYRNIIKLNNWIRSYSTQNKLWFCDTSKAVEDPKRPGTLAGTPDGLHPNVEGYRKMGDALTAVLAREFSSK